MDMVRRLTYREQSRKFLEQAQRELRAGDLRQASEKGWGAASQIVKAAAEARGWRHSAHRLLVDAAAQLSSDAGNLDIARLFWAAQYLHTNFYEGRMREPEVAVALEQTAQLVDKVEALLPQP